MTEKKEHESTRELIDAFRVTNQAIADNLVAAQERNMKFAQSILTGAMEVFKNHAESTQALMQELEQQAQKQQEAFKKLAFGSEESYTDFFRAPLAAYQRALEVVESTTRLELENFQKAAENFQKAAQQGLRTGRQAGE